MRDSQASGEPVPLTTLEMLDVLETGIVTLTRSRGKKAESAVAPATPGEVFALLEKAGISPDDFASLFDLPFDAWQTWQAGTVPMPPWVPAAAQMLTLLSATARRRLLNRQRVLPSVKTKPHPFSRIEEL